MIYAIPYVFFVLGIMDGDVHEGHRKGFAFFLAVALVSTAIEYVN